jgi:ankyrin repeat protein
MYRGDYDTTPLHMACKSRPPADVVSHLLSACPGAASLPDSFGWLPLHYACANEASLGVLALLASAYPGGSTSVDKRRRTPLHFALGHTDRPAEAEAVRLLGGTGAALMADENGMLVSS